MKMMWFGMLGCYSHHTATLSPLCILFLVFLAAFFPFRVLTISAKLILECRLKSVRVCVWKWIYFTSRWQHHFDDKHFHSLHIIKCVLSQRYFIRASHFSFVPLSLSLFLSQSCVCVSLLHSAFPFSFSLFLLSFHFLTFDFLLFWLLLFFSHSVSFGRSFAKTIVVKVP